jgi:2-polyprenyl-6-methoxyphenol hydroxylase-like FAD-dependent oxidoreductase
MYIACPTGLNRAAYNTPMSQSTSSSAQPIIIIGAGIGGLTTALQLHAHGLTNIRIFEAAPLLTTLGVGINVQPHAVLVLRNLGLLETLTATAISTCELNFYNRHGDEILREPRGVYAGYKVPQFSIHRGELQMLLLQTVKERLGEERVALGHAFVEFEQNDSSITAFFEQRKVPSASSSGTNGDSASDADDFVASIRGSVLIAADGINSTARRLFYPHEGPPRFSGRMLWRGCIERAPYLTGASMVWGGHANQKFIAYPISQASATRGRCLVNWICELRVREENDPDTAPPKTNWLETVSKDRFLPQFKGWEMGDLNVYDVVESTNKVFEFPMCDRDPVPQWSFGRLTLLGDAAHPMYPSKNYRGTV